MRRYILYSEEMGYFKPASSSGHLFYGRHKEDFTDKMEKATQYVMLDTAFEKMRGLMHNGVPEIEILELKITMEVVNRSSTEAVKDRDNELMKELREWVTSIDEMSLEERDALSKKEWIRYKNTKRNLKYVEDGEIPFDPDEIGM